MGGGVILQAGQGSGVCPSPVTPPPRRREILGSVLKLPWLPNPELRTLPAKMQDQLPPAG